MADLYKINVEALKTSLVPRPVHASRVTRGGLEPSANFRQFFPTSLTGDLTSEIAEDDWERGWLKTPLIA